MVWADHVHDPNIAWHLFVMHHQNHIELYSRNCMLDLVVPLCWWNVQILIRKMRNYRTSQIKWLFQMSNKSYVKWNWSVFFFLSSKIKCQTLTWQIVGSVLRLHSIAFESVAIQQSYWKNKKKMWNSIQIITENGKNIIFTWLFNLPDSMAQIQFESSDGMVNVGIVMWQLRLHWQAHQTCKPNNDKKNTLNLMLCKLKEKW